MDLILDLNVLIGSCSEMKSESVIAHYWYYCRGNEDFILFIELGREDEVRDSYKEK